MTREERRARIRKLVDAAPLLPPEDIDRLRALLPALRRTPAEPRPLPQPAATKAA